jgi:hypothetical protein
MSQEDKDFWYSMAVSSFESEVQGVLDKDHAVFLALFHWVGMTAWEAQ